MFLEQSSLDVSWLRMLKRLEKRMPDTLHPLIRFWSCLFTDVLALMGPSGAGKVSTVQFRYSMSIKAG
jgi:ABC-type uncharacterized transport system YnjBCD ATPase subunit